MAGPRISDQSVGLYREVLAARLSETSCSACGASLGAAAVVGIAGGTILEDYRLTEASHVKVLAATEELAVKCGSCGTVVEVGKSPRPYLPARTAERGPFSSPETTALYQSVLTERLSATPCPSCGLLLRGACLLKAFGGTALDDLGLSDESIVRVAAETQRLVVRCAICGATAQV